MTASFRLLQDSGVIQSRRSRGAAANVPSGPGRKNRRKQLARLHRQMPSIPIKDHARTRDIGALPLWAKHTQHIQNIRPTGGCGKGNSVPDLVLRHGNFCRGYSDRLWTMTRPNMNRAATGIVEQHFVCLRRDIFCNWLKQCHLMTCALDAANGGKQLSVQESDFPFRIAGLTRSIISNGFVAPPYGIGETYDHRSVPGTVEKEQRAFNILRALTLCGVRNV